MKSRWSDSDFASVVDAYTAKGINRDLAIRTGLLTGQAVVERSKARTSTGAVITVDGGNVPAMMR